MYSHMKVKPLHKTNKYFSNNKAFFIFFIGCFVLIAANFPEHVDNVNKVDVIMIDAGHGGEDPGATGQNGTKEKHITLAVARKLADRINRRSISGRFRPVGGTFQASPGDAAASSCRVKSAASIRG